MLLKAAQDYHIDLSQSWMIGDRESDIKAGKAAGCKTVLIGTLPSFEKANYNFKNLSEAIDFILEKK